MKETVSSHFFLLLSRFKSFTFINCLLIEYNYRQRYCRFSCSVLLSLQSNIHRNEWYLPFSRLVFLLNQFNEIFFLDISTFFLVPLFDKALCKLFSSSLSLLLWCCLKKADGVSPVYNMCVCLLLLSRSSFKYFELRIRMMKRTIIRWWRLWSNFECVRAHAHMP